LELNAELVREAEDQLAQRRHGGVGTFATPARGQTVGKRLDPAQKHLVVCVTQCGHAALGDGFSSSPHRAVRVEYTVHRHDRSPVERLWKAAREVASPGSAASSGAAAPNPGD